MFNNILVNHEMNPFAWDFSTITVQFELQEFSSFDKIQTFVIDESNTIKYKTSLEVLNKPIVTLNTEGWIQSCTSYRIQLIAYSDSKEVKGEVNFETGMENFEREQLWLSGKEEFSNNVFKYNLFLKDEVKSAKLYVAALGVYEAYINDIKIGTEYLAPGFSDYSQGIERQGYDVSEYLANSIGNQELKISVGDGWFKGNLGFEGGKDKIYGSIQMISPVLNIVYKNGQRDIITANDFWEMSEGPVTKSSIYYGEDFNDNHEYFWTPCNIVKTDKFPIIDRISPAVTSHEQFEPQIIETPSGDLVLDFKQNFSGWVEFDSVMKKNQEVTLEYGETLQEGEFYNKNLRFARAAFKYISNGVSKVVRPHFSYFGFRYVKVSGLTVDQIKKSKFKAKALYSNLRSVGSLDTDHPKVNKLWENILWGQRSNFLSIPTDCPQRDERLGWTGDAQIFSTTALYNYDCYSFFRKFMRDIRIDQDKLNGKVPLYSPSLGNTAGGISAWSDAITIIPWQVYLMHNDTTILSENYKNMILWIEWISKRVKDSDKSDILWWGDFQFGDWLALDGKDPSIPSGLTDTDFIASIYQYVSVSIVAKVSEILNNDENASKYYTLANKIKKEIQSEYFTSRGKLAVNTQTAFALVIYFDLVPENNMERITIDFLRILKEDRDVLTTGFIGTKLVCPALSKIGCHEKAVQIFLNEDYPGWMYSINLGATTVWERWNSILPDGSMNLEGMNSLNHYSYGAIMEWGYEYLLGIKPLTPGFEKFSITPGINSRIKHVSGSYQSTYGVIRIDWKISCGNQVEIQLSIPSGSTAILNLMDYKNGSLNDKSLVIDNEGKTVLSEGTYNLSYQTTKNYQEYYSMKTPLKFIIKNEPLWQKIKEIQPSLNFIDMDDNINKFGHQSLEEICDLLPFINIKTEEIEKIIELMKNMEIVYA